MEKQDATEKQGLIEKTEKTEKKTKTLSLATSLEKEKERALNGLKHTSRYAVAFIKWAVLSIVVGLVCGGVGCVFHRLIELATDFRGEHFHIIFLLPLGGLLIVLIYKLFRIQNIDGTNYTLKSVREDGYVPFGMAPGIFLGTVITHLLGGSAGREGAALQLGGSLGSVLGRIFRLDKKDLHVMVICGMSAVFSALFSTPLTAVVFVMEVISVGVIFYSAILPCIFSSVTAYYLTVLLDIHPMTYILEDLPEVTLLSLGQTVLLGVLFALMSIILCVTFSSSHRLIKKWIPNDWLRVSVGGTVIVLLTLVFGTDYNGAGMDIVNLAITEGKVNPAAFVLKLLFTAITLSCGYRGGEIVPTFFVGATFGCVIAPLIGMDPGFGAALGLTAVFCGATNAPLASLFLSIELFGGKGLPFFAVACGISYMLSGYYSLYHTQIIVHNKLKADSINRIAH